MILGIGTDLIMVSRVEQTFLRYGLRFVDKILSTEEKKRFFSLTKPNRRVNFLAKRFSAKESLLKAMGIGMGRGIDISDITIDYNDFGKPVIVIDDKKKMIVEKILNEKFESLNFLVSLTDENDMVSTFVIIDKIK
ncbi:MAG: holo-ACP synthase [Rickettsiales bacterium]|nr:holo-ACP synthase [Rickettsiales bacterium]